MPYALISITRNWALVIVASGLKLPSPVPRVISLAAMKETAFAYHASFATSLKLTCLKLTAKQLKWVVVKVTVPVSGS